MSADRENFLTLTQKYSILLLSANCNEPIRGKLWFQKELFLMSLNLERLETEAEFESDLMGPYSENADADLEQLRIEGLVEANGKIALTPKGNNLANTLKLKASKETLDLISEMKEFLNDLTEDELLGVIYFSYPEMKIESIKFQRVETKRKEVALSLFRKKKVSLGKAALIAGISEEDFIKKAQSSKISVFSE